MQFYPFNYPLTSVGSAVSSSLTVSASFIANFSSIPVTTASIALNVTGAAGTNGTGSTVTGPSGSVGLTGATGFRGNSVFLLSGSWHASGSGWCSGPVCYSFEIFTAELGGEPPEYACGALPLTVYSTSASIVLDDTTFYSDSLCTTLVGAGALGTADNIDVIITDSNGVFINSANCGVGV